MTKKLAVIDGKSIFYRGYYAMPGLSLADGTPTGGVYGFAGLAIELIKKIQPDYVAVAWDKKGTNIRRRREIYPDYKAGRKPAPDDFYAQIPILYELLDAFGWPLYEIDDYEADDIMGSFARQASEKGIETYLLTSDLDALQVISPLTKVYALKNGLSNLEEFHVDSFEEKYGIHVDQFLDLKSLKGDSSDNIPGVPGIGEKTAIELLQNYHDLDNIYDHLDEIKPSVAKKLIEGKASAYMSKEVSRIWDEAPVDLDWDVADVNDTDLERVEQILKKLEFHSFIKRLPLHMQKNAAVETKQASEAVEISEISWPENLQINGPIILNVENDEIFLSTSDQSFARKKIVDINATEKTLFSLATVVSYDVKTLYHEMAQNNLFIRFSEIHDIRQAAFLISPLRRDLSLDALSDIEITDVDQRISAEWSVYHRQMQILSGEEKLAKIAREFDFPLVYILFMMEYIGVKIDTELLAKMSVELGSEHDKLQREMFEMVGYEFNTASPLQLSEVLFTKLQLPTTGIKKGKTGYSTGQKELDKLRGQHPIIELIEQTRELAKLKSTYIDALPKLVDENNRIHTTFNQDVVSTGRLSSTNPNLQNIPIRTDLGRQIREAFIPEPGKILVSADYSQFELRLAAVLAGDEDMINVFNSGVDIHAKTASEVYSVPIDDVTKNQRRNAKVINFGVLYGMSPHGLSAATGMTFTESKKFIDQYFEIRKPILKYIKDTIDFAKNSGYVETYFGRRRPTPDVLSSNFMVRMSAERAAANMPIQGTEADLMKLAMLQVDKKIAGLGEQILQIHDSILVECLPENAEKIAEILRVTMENVAPELPVKLEVDVKIGKNWGEL